MKQWIVTGTSMVVEAETEQEAIERADQMSGWHWEAAEVTDIRIDLSDSKGVVCGGCGITVHNIPDADGLVYCPICGTRTPAPKDEEHLHSWDDQGRCGNCGAQR
jgi:hypothetical protein